jgi:hypothetical protein
MKPAESMANMVSRLQTLKLVLKQPEPASVFKFLDAIRPKSLADKVKDIFRMKEMDPNQWTVKDVEDIAIRLEKAQGEESLWTTSKPGASVVLPSGVSGGSSVKNTSVTCYHCGRLGHMKNTCPYKNTKATKKKAVTMHLLALRTQKLIVLTIRGAIHVTSLVILPRTVHSGKAT